VRDDDAFDGFGATMDALLFVRARMRTLVRANDVLATRSEALRIEGFPGILAAGERVWQYG